MLEPPKPDDVRHPMPFRPVTATRAPISLLLLAAAVLIALSPAPARAATADCRALIAAAEGAATVPDVRLDRRWGIVRMRAENLECREPMETWQARGLSWPPTEAPGSERPARLASQLDGLRQSMLALPAPEVRIDVASTAPPTPIARPTPVAPAVSAEPAAASAPRVAADAGATWDMPPAPKPWLPDLSQEAAMRIHGHQTAAEMVRRFAVAHGLDGEFLRDVTLFAVAALGAGLLVLFRIRGRAGGVKLPRVSTLRRTKRRIAETVTRRFRPTLEDAHG